ncbi:hypothetical protein L1987_32203 [Smallanthus sonchifolius]|uniref:Uncharacterized protein n=1 Tax=Smallanthus sonchifolius TaxID=185202 RepID=A0ACB9I9J8_9ASTR|nr:hypothetical protein L1987_32203 [Smallanthus sonchifolius]
MEHHRISSIQPKLDPVPINGDAIQATAHHKDKDHFQSKIKLMSCYRIDNYICDIAGNPPRVTLHPAIIRLSTTIVINPIPDPEGFPTYHFNFCQYEQLASLINRQQVFIDDTGTATATFFNDAVVSLLGKECEEVVKKGYENEFEVPKSLSEAIGHKKILQMQFEETPYRRSTHFTISRLSSPTHQQLLPDSTPPPSTTSEKAPIQETVDKPLPNSTPPPSTTFEKAPMQEIVDKPSAKRQLFLEEVAQKLEQKATKPTRAMIERLES